MHKRHKSLRCSIGITMKLFIVIPAYNEEVTIGKVVQELRALELPDIEKEVIVVDDGSMDRTGEVARSEGAVIVRHIVNRGVGGALGTGISAALRKGADIIVTYDADGQHAASDIEKVIGPIQNGSADVVLGTRMLDSGHMPWTRRIANQIANLITLTLFGIKTTDSQCGFRAYSRFAAQKIEIRSNHYEVCSEICQEIKRQKLVSTEVPIQVIYTRYSLSKGQSFMNGLRTLIRLLMAHWGKEAK